MKKFFERYVCWFEWIGAAIIIIFGVVMKVNPITLFFIVGAIFIIMGIFRAIPLIRTTSDKLTKWLFAVEILLEVGTGAYLIYLSFKDENQLGKVFGYLIGGVLYLRALIYFISTVLRKEPTDTMMFFAHIVFITFGSLIIGNGGFDINTLSWFILILALISALFIAIKGYKDYRNYRGQLVINDVTKKLVVNVEEEKEAEKKEMPTDSEIIHQGKIEEKDKKEEEINA